MFENNTLAWFYSISFYWTFRLRNWKKKLLLSKLPLDQVKACFPGTGPEKESSIEELGQFVFSSIQVLAPFGKSQ